MEMIYANNTHFHKKSDALGLILKVKVFGTRKWPITAFFVRVGTYANVRQVESLIRDFSLAGDMNIPSFRHRGNRDHRACVHQLAIITFVNGLYKRCYAFLL